MKDEFEITFSRTVLIEKIDIDFNMLITQGASLPSILQINNNASTLYKEHIFLNTNSLILIRYAFINNGEENMNFYPDNLHSRVRITLIRKINSKYLPLKKKGNATQYQEKFEEVFSEFMLDARNDGVCFHADAPSQDTKTDTYKLQILDSGAHDVFVKHYNKTLSRTIKETFKKFEQVRRIADEQIRVFRIDKEDYISKPKYIKPTITRWLQTNKFQCKTNTIQVNCSNLLYNYNYCLNKNEA